MSTKRRGSRKGSLAFRRVKSKRTLLPLPPLRSTRNAQSFHALKLGMTHYILEGVYTPVTLVRVLSRRDATQHASFKPEIPHRRLVAYDMKHVPCNMNRTILREVCGQGEATVKFDREYRVTGVTKGRGTLGVVQRWGVKLAKRKHSRSGHERGNFGSPRTAGARWQVPRAGIMGTMRRTQRGHRFLDVPLPETHERGVLGLNVFAVSGSVPGPTHRGLLFELMPMPGTKVR